MTTDINLLKAFNELSNREPKIIKTEILKDSMSTKLDQKYRRTVNSISWFQYFVNGAILEDDFKKSNTSLEYIETNHGILRGGRGNFIPDFKFMFNNKQHTLDTKTFKELSSFNDKGYNNFEGADYVVAFIIKEKTFYVRTLDRNTKTYSKAEKLADSSDQVINWIATPNYVKMVYFKVDSSVEIDSPTAEYFIATYKVID